MQTLRCAGYGRTSLLGSPCAMSAARRHSRSAVGLGDSVAEPLMFDGHEHVRAYAHKQLVINAKVVFDFSLFQSDLLDQGYFR